MAYTFDANILSDLHKDAFGVRPGANFMKAFHASSDDEKQRTWDALMLQLEASVEDEKNAEQKAIAEFEAKISEIQGLMNNSREDAIRIYVDSLDLSEDDKAYGSPYICYLIGLPSNYFQKK